jgi:OOP family OmpA-OmpF porin
MKHLSLLLIAAFWGTSLSYSQINVGGIIKRKTEDRANQKVEQGADKSLDKVEEGAKKPDNNNENNNSNSQQNNTNGNSNSSSSDGNTFSGTQPVSLKAYNNYDFVPGDKIIFEDDFLNDQDGEFPSHWDLISGQGVINKINGQPAFLLTEGNYVKVKPIMKTESYLTDPFTVEFDFFAKQGSYTPLVFFKTGDGDGKHISFGTEVHTGYFEHELSGTYPGDKATFDNKWHHAALIYKNGQMKCYVDQYRVLVIPKCGFVPEAVEIGGIGSNDNPLVYSNFRVASGGGMNLLNKIMTDGKYIAHGITFDVNKSTIKPESMGTLNELTKVMKENADLKFEIDGHTDSDGDDAANMKLSQARAEAVKTQLVSMGIDASRLTTKGFGETKPMDSNATPEGKANNRRVEFVKI